MKLEDLVDLDKLKTELQKYDTGIFKIWKDTALDIEHDDYQSVIRVYDCYKDIPASELRTDQIISFIESLLSVLKDPDKQRSLIQAEALQSMKLGAWNAEVTYSQGKGITGE